MIQVFVHGRQESGFIDLFPGTVLEMESLRDIFDEDLETGEFSLPIEFPWTETNRRILSFAERIQNSDKRDNYWMVDVFDNGLPELVQAKLTLLEKDGNYGFNRGKFSASISGNKGLFGSRIKNKSLRDLTFPAISWEGKTSRQFAEEHMKGLHPQYPFLAFAPVVIENFYDTSKNYNGEFLALDTVNNIIITGSGVDDWTFGRPKPDDLSVPVPAGEAEYIDYATVPFFKMIYVFRQAFKEAGYEVIGDLVNSLHYEDLYIFNPCGIEFYSPTAFQDYTTKILPAQHLPDMSLLDFFRAIFKFFNVYPVFHGNNRVELHYRKKVIQRRRVLDITERCALNFHSTYLESTERGGYTIEYDWDQADSYINDRIKDDLSDLILVATVETRPNLDTLDIGRSFTTNDVAFVKAENMYYRVANATTSPVLWDAYSEALGAHVVGDGERKVTTGCGTLATYVMFDEDQALYKRQNKLACRMTGSYWNRKLIRVNSEFGLSLFYIRKQNIGGINIPVSFNHNVNPANVKMAELSLSITATEGLSKLHDPWQSARDSRELFKVEVKADKRFMQDLKECDAVQIQNVLYIPQLIENSIPLGETVVLHLICI